MPQGFVHEPSDGALLQPLGERIDRHYAAGVEEFLNLFSRHDFDVRLNHLQTVPPGHAPAENHLGIWT